MMKSISLLILLFFVGQVMAKPPKVDGKPGIVLITSPELAEAWKPFAEWKNRQGKPTYIVTTDGIAKAFNGRDLQEKIRKCVRKHIDQRNVRWVILGGDSQPGA